MKIAETQRVLAIILVLNLAVAAAKAGYGYTSGSLAVASDAIHSLADALSNVVGLVIVYFAARPPDKEHPYGHRKLEVLAATAVGVIIGFGALQFGWSALSSLWESRPAPTVTPIGIGVLVTTLVVNIFVSTYEARKGRELDSRLLSADAAHTASDVLVTIAVLGSQALVWLGLRWADPLVAGGVVIVVLRVAWKILSSNADVLIDRSALDSEVVRKTALSVEGVAGCHRVRSRGVEGHVQLDLHITVAPKLTVERAHEISHAVEAALRAKMPQIRDVTIHVEPKGDPPESL